MLDVFVYQQQEKPTAGQKRRYVNVSIQQAELTRNTTKGNAERAQLYRNGTTWDGKTIT